MQLIGSYVVRIYRKDRHGMAGFGRGRAHSQIAFVPLVRKAVELSRHQVVQAVVVHPHGSLLVRSGARIRVRQTARIWSAEVRDSLEIWRQTSRKPDQLHVVLRLALQLAARLNAVPIPVDVDLQQGSRVR